MRAIDADKIVYSWQIDADGQEHDGVTLQSIIDKMPTIEPERKTGRWIHDGYAFKSGIDWMHCSECGHKDSWSAATRTPFCAWCGARMEEPEDIPMEYFESGGR